MPPRRRAGYLRREDEQRPRLVPDVVCALARAAGLQHREQSPEHARIDALPLSPQRPPDEPRDVGSCCRRLHNGGSRQRQQPRPVEEAEELLGRVCLDILCAPTIPSTPSLIPSSKWKVPSRRTFVSRQSASVSAASCSVQRRRKRLPSTTPSKMCVTNSPPRLQLRPRQNSRKLPPPWCRCPPSPRDSRSLPSTWRPSSRRC